MSMDGAVSLVFVLYINTLYGQNVEFVTVKHVGTYSNHWALKSQERGTSYRSIAQIHAAFCTVFVA
jgi:hypothetical protein